MEKKLFTPNTLTQINYLSALGAHPQKNKISYVKSDARTMDGTFQSHILCLDCGCGVETELFPQMSQTKSPKYSSDGKMLAFLSDQTGVFQLYLWMEESNTLKQLTTLRHGVTFFSWAEDGSKIGFTGPVWATDIEKELHFTEMTKEERSLWQEEKEWEPVEIEEIDYKNDDCFGLRDGSVETLAIVEIASATQYLVTGATMPCSYPAFSLDGSELGFYAMPYSGAYRSCKEFFISTAEDGKFHDYVQVTQKGSVNLMADCPPVFSEDKSKIYLSAYVEYENNCSYSSLITLDPISGVYKNLLPDTKESPCTGVSGEPISRTVYGDEMPYFRQDPGKKYLYFTNAWMGWQNLYRISLADNSVVETVLEAQINVHGFDFGAGGELYLLGGDFYTIPEIFSWDSSAGLKRLTYSNKWMDEYQLGQVETRVLPSKDGKTTLMVWIMHPAKEEPGKKYPMVLDIHGGPECSYVSDFWHEFQAIAGSGAYCVYTNPRGSYGQGPSHAGVEECWGIEAMEDLLLAVDVALEAGQIDPKRIGVTGGSYGGYMTNKLIMDSNRFGAAVTQRCLVNTGTSYGTGDMGFISRGNVDLSQVKMLEYLSKRVRKSPICKVDSIQVPLLILHGFKDYRCGFEQAEQLFIAVHERNPQLPVKLVMFPEDNHGITRTGRLRSQIRHLKELVDWFEQYLKEEFCHE